MLQSRPVQKAAVWLLDRLQKRVPYSPHNMFLEGPFAPVKEEHDSTDLRITGTLPPELDGLLARIGPNPLEVPNPATHHWFLGDGMVHGLRLKEGRALWYRSRYVGVDNVNRRLGRPRAPGPRHSISDVVNTNIIGHGGSLWALVEATALPVELDADLNTVKHGMFDSRLKASFTAHPHKDPATGELHAICYDGFDQKHIRYLVIGTDRQVKKNLTIPVRHGPMMHDSALTEKNVLLLDLPVTFSLSAALKGAGLPYAWNPKHPARVGKLPRNGTADDVRWYDIEPCFVFHTCNAFENDNGDTVLDVVVHQRMFDQSIQGPEPQQVTFERWTLPREGTHVQRQVISREGQEFPRFDERLTGKPYRYAYAVSLNLDNQANALLRHDLETGESTQHAFGPDWTAGEFVFVPRHDGTAENDGWLMGYVHHRENLPSKVVILGARDLTTVAEVQLPVRVPLGFHGNWIPAHKPVQNP